MPYAKNRDLPKPVRDALPEGAQTTYRKAHNGAGKLYGYGNETRLSKIARSVVKRDYKQDKDKRWVPREGVKAAAQEEHAKGKTHKYTTESWVPTAKVGQDVVISGNPERKPYTLSAEAFKAAEGTWVDGVIRINHGGQWEGHKILDEKFDGKFLYAKFDQEVIDELNSAETTGGSIDALVIEHDSDLNAIDMVGTGYSLTYAGFNPRCTFEMGCAGTIESKGNIPTGTTTGELVTAETPGYVESQMGGGHKDMTIEVDKADNVETVTYTNKQLDERVAGALEAQKEASDNALKVAVSEAVETQKTEDDKVIDGLKTEKDASDALIKAQADAALKERRATFMQRNNVEEDSELIKRWDAVETIADAQALMNAIEYSPQQVAGASSGNVAEEKVETETILEAALTKLGNKYGGGGT